MRAARALLATLATLAAVGMVGAAAATGTPAVASGTPAATTVLSGAHAAASGPSDTAALGQLQRYLHNLKSLSAHFTQRVTDAHGASVSSGSGTLLLQRPGKFRWTYLPGGDAGEPAGEGGQVLVADGHNLWLYDRDLAEVTVRPLSSALTATPLMLLTAPLARLRASFRVRSEPAHAGLSWVEVRPRSENADFMGAQLGFRGGELQHITFQDRLGQTVQLAFTHIRRNADIAPSQLRFTPPPGADVIGKPVS